MCLYNRHLELLTTRVNADSLGAGGTLHMLGHALKHPINQTQIAFAHFQLQKGRDLGSLLSFAEMCSDGLATALSQMQPWLFLPAAFSGDFSTLSTQGAHAAPHKYQILTGNKTLCGVRLWTAVLLHVYPIQGWNLVALRAHLSVMRAGILGLRLGLLCAPLATGGTNRLKSTASPRDQSPWSHPRSRAGHN